MFCRRRLPLTSQILVLLALALWAESQAGAIPYYARKYGVNCTQCHVLPPMLNEFGQRFLANGYRLPELQRQTSEFPEAIPIAAWNTYRFEANQENDWAKGYPNRVELISSDSVTPWLSYFVEWRTLSYQTNSSGRLKNRSGRFEDLFVTFTAPKRLSVTVGQFRMINQWDVSRRLTLSTPRTFGAGVAGEPSVSSSRLTSLRTFSWSGRAPAVRATWVAKPGSIESDGWFHEFTVPFSGEFSAPLGSEPERTASFQLEARPKGFVYETYFRRSLNSIGAAAFVGRDRWLANLTGVLRRGDHYFMASAGTAKWRTGLHDFRLSIDHNWVPRPWVAIGALLDHQSAAGRKPGFTPHVNFSFPNKKYTFLIVVQQRLQEDNFATGVEVGVVF